MKYAEKEREREKERRKDAGCTTPTGGKTKKVKDGGRRNTSGGRERDDGPALYSNPGVGETRRLLHLGRASAART